MQDMLYERGQDSSQHESGVGDAHGKTPSRKASTPLESITEEKRDLVAHILAREPDPMPAVDLPDPEVLEGASTATIAAQRPEQRAADRAPIEGRPK